MVSQMTASRDKRLKALADFTAIVHTPESMKQAAELRELVKANAAANDRMITLVRAGKPSAVLEAFRASSAVSAKVRAKAEEAVQWQVQLGARHDQDHQRTASLVWMVIVAGSLLSVVGALVSGVVLTRSIARPLASVVVIR